MSDIGGSPATEGSIDLDSANLVYWKNSSNAAPQAVSKIMLDGVSVWAKDFYTIEGTAAWSKSNQRLTLNVEFTAPTGYSNGATHWTYQINTANTTDGTESAKIAIGSTSATQYITDWTEEGDVDIVLKSYDSDTQKETYTIEDITIDQPDYSISLVAEYNRDDERVYLTATLGEDADPKWGWKGISDSSPDTWYSTTNATKQLYSVAPGTYTVGFRSYKSSWTPSGVEGTVTLVVTADPAIALTIGDETSAGVFEITPTFTGALSTDTWKWTCRSPCDSFQTTGAENLAISTDTIQANTNCTQITESGVSSSRYRFRAQLLDVDGNSLAYSDYVYGDSTLGTRATLTSSVTYNQANSTYTVNAAVTTDPTSVNTKWTYTLLGTNYQVYLDGNGDLNSAYSGNLASAKTHWEGHGVKENLEGTRSSPPTLTSTETTVTDGSASKTVNVFKEHDGVQSIVVKGYFSDGSGGWTLVDTDTHNITIATPILRISGVAVS